MRIEGEISKGKKYWEARVPLLLVNTQGKTKNEAYAMVKDAIELMMGITSFEITVHPERLPYFSISSTDDALLLGFALKQQRAKHHLTIRDVVSRMGKRSVTAYTRYENGGHKLNLDKLTEILTAISPDLEPVLRIG